MEYSPYKSLFRWCKIPTCHISSGPTENHQSQTQSQNPTSPFSCPTSCPALRVKYRGSYRWHGLVEKVTIDCCYLHFFRTIWQPNNIQQHPTMIKEFVLHYKKFEIEIQTISACLTVRGKPSNRKPFLQADESRFFSMSSTTISSLTWKHRH